MNRIFKVCLLAALLSAPSFAIFGIGGHLAPNMGKLDGARDYAVGDAASGGVVLDQAGFDGMSGFGLKMYIDVLPYIDIEAGMNLQWNRYDALLVVEGPDGDSLASYPIDVKFDGMPFGRQKPVFSQMVFDASITYPFLKLPPAVSILKLYVGAGISYMVATPVLDKEFAEKVLAGTDVNALVNDPNAGADLATNMADQLAKDGLDMGIGGHVLAGARAKLPIIPIAAYANTKYYFGGPASSAFSNGVVFELGGALAF